MTTLYEEISVISGKNVPSLIDHESNRDLSTKTRVSMVDSSTRNNLNGLLDSRASGTHIKRFTLKHVKYIVADIDVEVKG